MQNKEKNWTEEQGLNFIYQVVEALKELHDNRIVCLDINLKNIIIDETIKDFRFIHYGVTYKIKTTEQMDEIPAYGTKEEY